MTNTVHPFSRAVQSISWPSTSTRSTPRNATRSSMIRAPLLIIAGAGSGKTNTLAHRVAHLILGGADARRILLLTFSRRAAAEMSLRAQRILARAAAGGPPAHVTWAGTFHAVANRLLRLHAADVGLDPAFTVLDRSDAADSIDVVRNDLGLAKTERRFPKKSTCLAIYSRAVNAQEPLGKTLDESFPWCKEHADELRKRCSPRTSSSSSGSTCSTTTTSCSTGCTSWRTRRWRRACAAASTTSSSTSTRTPTRCRRRSCCGCAPTATASPSSATTRSRSMPFARRRCATSSISRAVLAAGAGGHARGELPLDAADPRRRQRGHRARRRALHQEPALDAALRGASRCSSAPPTRRRRSTTS